MASTDSPEVDVSKLQKTMHPAMLGRFGFCEACKGCKIMVDLRRLCEDCSDEPIWKEPNVACSVHRYVNCTSEDCEREMEKARSLHQLKYQITFSCKEFQ